MIEKKIEFEDNEFIKGKIIKGKLHTYVEYRNNDIGKIKFFELKDNRTITEITNKDDLKYAVERNYIINENI